MTPTALDPLSGSEPEKPWPSFTLSGRTYEVKIGLLSEYYVSLWGFEFPSLLSIIQTKRLVSEGVYEDLPSNPKRNAYMLQLLAAATAHNFTAPDRARTVEEWLMALEGHENSLKDAIRCVMEAVIKHVSARLKKVVPTPTVEKAETTLTQ